MAPPAMDLPCDGDGVCMVCKAAPSEAEVALCRTCATPWHAPCLSEPLRSMADVVDWLCPDCSLDAPPPPTTIAGGGGGSELVAAIRAIEADASLTEQEKAKRRQALLCGGKKVDDDEDEEGEEGDEDGVKKRKTGRGKASSDVLDLLDEKFNCAFCMQLPDRPVTTPCGHNFCLKCFQKWVSQGKRTCAQCRSSIPAKMAEQPRINSALVAAIRMAKSTKSGTNGPTPVSHFIRNENRPEKAFTTERAKKAGKANACSGQIFVTVPPDHFGPILAENDPKRNQGVLVGETWEDRMECRQWGAHLPHVAGIAGQSDHGSQSVALSGGYQDDEDHGEWFLYTGSGGRDLSGNKRTNKEQSFDQKFEKLNAALRVSCLKGYPVRVVRSHKEKRSSYAPEAGVRYDGIYRIEKCWRKVGIQGFKVCRYLFVRCDNEPAPWTSDEHGDRPRSLPAISELKNATDITVRKESPAWDYDEKHGWKWMKPPPVSKKPVTNGNLDDRKRGRKPKRLAQNTSVKERLLKEFSCLICREVMTLPLTTPCGHNFCKSCLLGAFADKSFVRERTREGGRALRAQKIVKKCPSCPVDISDFLQNPQVNRELKDLIESLQSKIEEENIEQQSEDNSEDGTVAMEDNIAEKSSEDGPVAMEDNIAGEPGNQDAEKADKEEPDCGEGMKLSEEESAIADNKLESADGDSDVNINSEVDEKATETALDPESVANPQPSRKRKITVGQEPDVKKGKKDEEDTNTVDKTLNAEKPNEDVKPVDLEEKPELDLMNSEMEENVQNEVKQPVSRKQNRAAKTSRKGEKKSSKEKGVPMESTDDGDDDDDFQ